MNFSLNAYYDVLYNDAEDFQEHVHDYGVLKIVAGDVLNTETILRAHGFEGNVVQVRTSSLSTPQMMRRMNGLL